MHQAIDVRTAAVIPALLDQAPFDDEEIRQARQTGSALLEALVGAAHRAGTLRADVTPGDIGLLIVRLSRPLPGAFHPGTNTSLSHRHLDLLIDGLRGRSATGRPLPLLPFFGGFSFGYVQPVIVAEYSTIS